MRPRSCHEITERRTTVGETTEFICAENARRRTKADRDQKNPRALRFAAELNSEITLLHVLEPDTPLTLAERPAGAAFSEEELADAEESLRGLADSAKAAGAAATKSLLRTGIATNEIVNNIELVIVVTAA